MDDYDGDFGEKTNSWSVLNSVFYILENYGWHLLFLVMALIVIYNKMLKSLVQRYKESKFEREYAAKYHKNPDVFAAHVNAQQDWIQKMQEKYNKESEEHQKKMKEKEERKRQELTEKYGSTDVGHILGSKKSNKRQGLRDDYNPLMGSGSSSTYRPPRRSPCGGGGCGK